MWGRSRSKGKKEEGCDRFGVPATRKSRQTYAMNADSAGRAKFGGLGLNGDISSRRGTKNGGQTQKRSSSSTLREVEIPEVIERRTARGTRGNQP